ncbi:hypothetical protein ABZ412_15715 [Nocardia sp. NPDC005746]|uniref:hypothetical protein n=1 Tax=Nocardia sp. NPDC005746 TaxID=3157062 RepID=UPI00340215F4
MFEVREIDGDHAVVESAEADAPAATRSHAAGQPGAHRQLLDADIYSRTADFTTIPDRIRRRWRATADDLLPRAYLRYQCVAIVPAAHEPQVW